MVCVTNTSTCDRVILAGTELTLILFSYNYNISSRVSEQLVQWGLVVALSLFSLPSPGFESGCLPSGLWFYPAALYFKIISSGALI